MTDTDKIADYISDLLLDDGPVALVIKQQLAPIDEDERVIFPPTYPVTDWKGRVHTIRDGDYCVTIELPTGSKADKDEKTERQRPGYQIDRFPDGTNICEIDSVQSQSNRVEPRFKKLGDGKLVPQIEIQAGNQKVNLLDIGHRAGDALVRFSTLAADIHDAFLAAKSRDFFKLATLAPTSLVFGVWDSRSTQVKQQRVFKANIRATNVRELSRSAQYTPPIAYVDAGAIGDDVEKKERDESNLSQEGMVHALSTQGIGGVTLTEKSRLLRTVTVNFEAIRGLHGTVNTTAGVDQDHGAKLQEAIDSTKQLQNYILGLALVAAFNEPELNLREGCNLKYANGQERLAKLVYRSKPDEACPFGWDEALAFAKSAKSNFFQCAGIDENAIDRRDVKFESGIAEKFLSYSQPDRDKIRKLGPITQQTLDRFERLRDDPFKPVIDELKKVKSLLGKRPGKKDSPVVRPETFENVAKLLEDLSKGESLPEAAAALAAKLAQTARAHENSHEAVKSIEDQIKDYKRALKTETADQNTSPDSTV